MYANEKCKLKVNKIIQFIKNIGETGAYKEHFRHERLAEALPPPHYHYLATDEDGLGYGLRLYCIRLTNNIVILLNGDIKTTQKANDCPNCGKYFRFANMFSDKLNIAILGKYIKLNGKNLEIENDFELEI